MKGQHLTVDHHVDRGIEFELDPAYGLALGKAVLNVCAIVETAQVADQAKPSDRAPADVFDQAVIDLGSGGDHHRPTRELAVIEGQEQTAAIVTLRFSLDAKRKWAAVETS